MWTLYQHFKGGLYLGLGRALHSETEEAFEQYRCLYPSKAGQAWVRPADLFHGLTEAGKRRFEPLARVRVVMPEDEPVVLRFGFDAWGKGRSLEDFVASYATEPDHLRGTRYLLETLDGVIVADLNTLRFQRAVVGIASVAAHPEHRGRGHVGRLLRAVLELFRAEDASTRFLLFSEVVPAIYERVGFEVLPDTLQHHPPSVAMATGLSQQPLREDEARWLRRYF